MNYVCGFLFSFDLKKFVLIKKNRGPDEMAGKWNGVGGKISQYYIERRIDGQRIYIPEGEESKGILHMIPEGESAINYIIKKESPHEAMIREFKEETGVWIDKDRWHCFYKEQYAHTGHTIYYMVTFGDEVHKVKTITDEEVKVFDLVDFVFDSLPLVWNIRSLVSFILSAHREGFLKMLNPDGVNKYK